MTDFLNCLSVLLPSESKHAQQCLYKTVRWCQHFFSNRQSTHTQKWSNSWIFLESITYLNTGSSTLLAKTARQSPSACWDMWNFCNWFHFFRASNANLRIRQSIQIISFHILSSRIMNQFSLKMNIIKYTFDTNLWGCSYPIPRGHLFGMSEVITIIMFQMLDFLKEFHSMVWTVCGRCSEHDLIQTRFHPDSVHSV